MLSRASSPTRASRALIRHSLNLESGLNDGLALPAVLAFTAAAAIDPDFTWWKFVLQDVTIGFATGALVGLAASYLMPRGRALGIEVSSHQKAMFGLGVAFAAYGVAVLPPEGNGLISTFVAAIVLGIRRPDIRASFEGRAEDIIEVVKLGVFVVFGSLFTFGELFGDGWAAVAIVAITLLVARPVAVFGALAGTRTDVAERAFMSWFGPKGVATMTFALLVLAENPPGGERVASIAALAVLASIFLHGLTDHPGSEWMARHAHASKAVNPDRPASASGSDEVKIVPMGSTPASGPGRASDPARSRSSARHAVLKVQDSNRRIDVQLERLQQAIAKSPVRLALIMLIAGRFIGGAVYSIAEPDADWFDGAWWALVTQTTVGYGDFAPETSSGVRRPSS